MLWLALHFPSLPLDVSMRGASDPGSLAIASSSEASAVVVACSPAARRRGVQPGMALAAACALDAGLKIFIRDVAAEQAALERVAAWAIQYTPATSIASPAGVLLEIAGSLHLFGGLNRLCGSIERDVAELGYAACVACAPTPLAAQWFARAGLALKIRHHDALRHALERLPAAVLGQPPRVATLLEDIGVRTVGDVLSLPRDGVARRFGQPLIDSLDRALGRLPDVRPPFIPPSRFTAALPLPAPVHEAEALIFAARRLISELCGLLGAGGNGAQELHWMLTHEDREDTSFVMKLAAATRDPEHLASVLRERLGRMQLAGPVTTIALASGPLVPLPARSLSFLPATGDHSETVSRLIERLRGRLGDGAVKGLGLAADHRPEQAWRTSEPGHEDNVAGSARRLPRPLWLLAAPQRLDTSADVPCYEGSLTLLAGPERIESGWWDGADVTRDYFVARTAAQSLLWIYRERRDIGAWYLHGFFA
jgi:protein ImuB